MIVCVFLIDLILNHRDGSPSKIPPIQSPYLLPTALLVFVTTLFTPFACVYSGLTVALGWVNGCFILALGGWESNFP